MADRLKGNQRIEYVKNTGFDGGLATFKAKSGASTEFTDFSTVKVGSDSKFEKGEEHKFDSLSVISNGNGSINGNHFW